MNLSNIVYIFDRPNDLTSTLPLSVSSVLLAGEGIWHYFPARPVAHHHASAHQENHTGWREQSLLNFFHPHSLCKSLASSFLPWTSRFHFSTICNWPVALILFTDKFSFLSHDKFVSNPFRFSVLQLWTLVHTAENITFILFYGSTGQCVFK